MLNFSCNLILVKVQLKLLKLFILTSQNVFYAQNVNIISGGSRLRGGGGGIVFPKRWGLEPNFPENPQEHIFRSKRTRHRAPRGPLDLPLITEFLQGILHAMKVLLLNSVIFYPLHYIILPYKKTPFICIIQTFGKWKGL